MLDRETPSRRTRFSSGNIWRTSSTLVCSSSVRLLTGAGRVLLRVMIWKSAYYTFTVTVRPAMPVRSQ
jgi:hypothetical protein